MTDETTAPSDEQIAVAQEAATAIVASSVADLVILIEGADVLTLRLALEGETAKGDAARKTAIAALEAALENHPDLSADDASATATDATGAKDADAADDVQREADAEPAADNDSEAESNEADGDVEEPAEQTATMAHPGGGTCDAYPAGADGTIEVPLADVPLMRDHGFEIITA